MLRGMLLRLLAFLESSVSAEEHIRRSPELATVTLSIGGKEEHEVRLIDFTEDGPVADDAVNNEDFRAVTGSNGCAQLVAELCASEMVLANSLRSDRPDGVVSVSISYASNRQIVFFEPSHLRGHGNERCRGLPGVVTVHEEVWRSGRSLGHGDGTYRNVGPHLVLSSLVGALVAENGVDEGSSSNEGASTRQDECRVLLPFSGCRSTLRTGGGVPLGLEIGSLMLVGFAFSFASAGSLFWGFHYDDWKRRTLAVAGATVCFGALIFFFGWAYLAHPFRLLGVG